MINQSFGNFHQFIAMGGFGDYVWSAYGVTTAVLVWLVASTMRQYKKMVPSKKLTAKKKTKQ